ncbi:MAG: ABC transporter ATP-binding protein [Bdellovibrionota bacterium]
MMKSTKENKKRSGSFESFRRLIDFAKEEKPWFLRSGLFSILNKIFDIAPEILIGVAIDVVVSKETSFVARFGVIEPWHQILVLAVLTFFVWVFESIFEYLHLISWRGLAQVIQHKLRTKAYAHLQSLDLGYFENQSTGNLVAVLNDDINQLERFLDGGMNEVVQTATAAVGVGAVFFYLSPEIAWLAITPIPIIVVGAFYFQKRAEPLYAKVRDQVGVLASRLNNNISGILTIKSFTGEEIESTKMELDSLDYVKINSKAISVSSAFTPIIRLGVLSGFLATLVYGGWKVLHGSLNIGAYGVLIFLTQRLLWPMTRLATTVDLYERAMASTRRVLDLMNIYPAILSGPLHVQKIRGHYRFEHVTFGYESGPVILQDLQLEILPQKTTALVGLTGSGKSTIIKLLSRYYEVTQGNIYLDGNPLQDYNLKALRKRIGLVSQDVFLFHGTIRENLCFHDETIQEDQLVRACVLAEAHDFILTLDKGYDTVVGERGQKLSGGQRQRLSIARAILKDPDVLILDEATSAVDNETEAAIQRSIAKISKNRTTVVVAHRLSTITEADHIYVLDHGKIVESGKHRDLLESNHIYAKLWNVQTGGKAMTSNHEIFRNQS